MGGQLESQSTGYIPSPGYIEPGTGLARCSSRTERAAPAWCREVDRSHTAPPAAGLPSAAAMRTSRETRGVDGRGTPALGRRPRWCTNSVKRSAHRPGAPYLTGDRRLAEGRPLLLLHGKTDSREVCVTAGLLVSCAEEHRTAALGSDRLRWRGGFRVVSFGLTVRVQHLSRDEVHRLLFNLCSDGDVCGQVG